MATNSTAIGWGGETEFEKRRGVSAVEIRGGFAQAHVSHLEGDLVQARLEVLKAIGEKGISLDFLKLTPSGLSFLIKQDECDNLEQVLTQVNAHHSIKPSRAIVLVHAVNIRDEEGMLAGIMHAAMSSSAKVDHISDMHDRLLMVVDAEDAERLRAKLEESGLGGSHAN